MDPSDAATPVTVLTLGGADQAELLKANGAATVDISGNTFGAVVSGWYDLDLTATDTNTTGELDIVIQDTDVCLPIFVRAQVVTQAVYDTMYAAAAVGPSVQGDQMALIANAVNTTTLQDGAITAAKIAAAAITSTKIAAGAITSAAYATGAINANALATGAITAAKIASDAITAAKIAANAITSAKIATDAITASQIAASAIGNSEIAAGAISAGKFATDAIDANALSASAVNEIADQIWDELFAGHAVAGSFGEMVAATIFDHVLNTRRNVQIATGSVGVGSTTFTIVTDLTGFGDDYFNGEQLSIHGKDGGSGEQGAVRNIEDYVSATGTFVVSALNGFPFVPTNGDTVDVVGRVGPASAATDLSTILDHLKIAEYTVAVGSSTTQVLTTSIKPDGYYNNSVVQVVAQTGLESDTSPVITSTLLNGAFNLSTALGFAPLLGDTLRVLTLNSNITSVEGLTPASIAAEVDTVLSASHGATGWETATGFAVAGDAMALTAAAVDDILDELLAGHSVVGSVGEALARLDEPVSGLAHPGDAMALTGAMSQVIANTMLITPGGAAQPGSVQDKLDTLATAIASVPDDVWDELLAGHLTPGSAGEVLFNSGGGSSPAVVAAAVWDALAASHVLGGSFGKILQDILTTGGAGPWTTTDLSDSPVIEPA